MNNLIRYWNQNRKKIVITIAIVAFVLLFIQIMNKIAKNNNSNTTYINTEKKEENLPTKSIISGQETSKETTTNNMQIIENFIKKCNEADIEGAYNLLTDECKETLFSTKEEFISNYYNLIFTEKRTFGIKNFINIGNFYTYEVKFYNDALSTGNINQANIYTDYITIDSKKEENNISINSFITSKEVNKITEDEGITFKVIKQEIYKECERYQIEIKNSTNKNILLDTNRSTKTLYAINSNGNKISSYLNEIPRNLLILEAGRTRTYTIKFNKLYSLQSSLESIVFSDIVMDYDTYKENLTQYTQMKEIQVAL